ncbi:hypothetical protein Dsin_008797 [Dipteronia sinensis]|uniref:Uncharacterized protein n=1 Tax=Dipteronia sinensis TaxID=43782 RepID=A0AAE0AQL2_9ROSI|nr:hypothetical protein Dsin_008797 [Dipteronia sinensis]
MVVATTRVGGRRRSLHVHHRLRHCLASLAAAASVRHDTIVWTTVLSQIYLAVESLFLPRCFSVPIPPLFHRDIVASVMSVRRWRRRNHPPFLRYRTKSLDNFSSALETMSAARDEGWRRSRQGGMKDNDPSMAWKKRKAERIRRSLRTRGMTPDYEGLRDDVFYSVNEIRKTLSHVNVGPLSFKDAYAGTGSDKVLIYTILSVVKTPHCGLTREEIDTVSVVKRKPQVGITVKEELDGVKPCKGESLNEKGELGSRIKEEAVGFNLNQVVKLAESVLSANQPLCAYV